MRDIERREFFGLGAGALVGAAMAVALAGCTAATDASSETFEASGTTWYSIRGSEAIGGIGITRIELLDGGSAVVGVQIVTAEGAESVKELIEGLVEQDIDYILSGEGSWSQDGESLTVTTADGDETLWKFESRDGVIVLLDAAESDSTSCFYQDFDMAREQALEQVAEEQ